MINDTADIEVTSTISGQKIQMKIADDALIHIMDMLTELYEDPELAIIREYSTNARDAHIEAGVTRPIEVILPSHLEPVFKVRDYGKGLSIQDIQNIYSQYGKTTKDESNDFTGSLGVGCKSALAYTSQFTFTSIKDGVRCVVVVARDEDGVASMTVVDTSVTDDPSGVEITIPVKRFHSLEHKARELFKYWDEGTVLVNGEAPKRITGLELSPNLILVQGNDYDHRVVMGNIPYPARFDRWDIGLPDGYSIAAFVDIGTVHYTPAREALKYTKKTKDAIALIEQEVVNGLKEAIVRDINAAENKFDALKRYVHWERVAGKILAQVQVPKYADIEIPTSIKAPDGEKLMLTSGAARNYSKYSHHPTLGVSYVPHTIFVYGYDKYNMSAYNKKKMRQYCVDNNIQIPEHFVLTQTKISNEWIPDERMVSFENIKAIKLPRAWSGGTRGYQGPAKGTYNVNIDGDLHPAFPANQIDTSKPVYYDIEDKINNGFGYLRVLEANVENFTLVTMYKNREAKFLREFPMAVSAPQAARNFFEAWKKAISTEDFLATYIQFHEAHYKVLDPVKLKDPELVRYARLGHRNIANLLQEMKIYSRFGVSQYRIDELAEVDGFKDPLDKYPLASDSDLRYNRMSKTQMDHLYIYLNAAYEAGKGN